MELAELAQVCPTMVIPPLISVGNEAFLLGLYTMYIVHLLDLSIVPNSLAVRYYLVRVQ